MPESNHPPYGISTIQPRTLNRWLDVNSQNGPLKRCRGFIRFSNSAYPAYHINWNGNNSIKYAQFNFQATRNFSIIIDDYFRAFVASFSQHKASAFLVNVIDDPSSDINFVVRYRLTDEGYDTVGAIPYVGQPILGKYFQIEYWSAGVIGIDGTVDYDLSVVYTLNTSILGTLDYRFSDDFRIHSAEPELILYGDYSAQNPDIPNAAYGLPAIFQAKTINGVNHGPILDKNLRMLTANGHGIVYPGNNNAIIQGAILDEEGNQILDEEGNVITAD